MLLGAQGHRQVSAIEFWEQAMEVCSRRASQGCGSGDFLFLLTQVCQQREASWDGDRYGRRRDHWESQRADMRSTCLL
jgi:hypothetical protein